MSARLTRPLQAVTFDLDYTLWDLAGVIEHAEVRAYDFLAAEYPTVARALSFEDFLGLRGSVARACPDLAHDVTALRRAVFRRCGEAGGYAEGAIAELVERAFAEFIDARHDVVLFEDALPVLQWLRTEGLRLGAITNGNADLERIGLRGYFDFALSAMDVGAAKPSHLVFEAARGRIGVAMGAIAHVGDDPHSDVTGAAQWGMQAVWLNRDGEPWPADAPPRPPCVELRSLDELREQIRALRLAGPESG